MDIVIFFILLHYFIVYNFFLYKLMIPNFKQYVM